MTELYKNKYRIPSARLQTWDYANSGRYFVTICTADRECLFGQILKKELSVHPNESFECEIELNELGRIVETEWLKTAELRPDMNLELFEYVVMPNHFHGIISIGENEYNTISNSTTTNQLQQNKFGRQGKNLASIIRGFKSAVTTYARKNDFLFDWQPRYHDHIIRTDAEYLRIADYIVNNPDNWQKDKFYKPSGLTKKV